VKVRVAAAQGTVKVAVFEVTARVVAGAREPVAVHEPGETAKPAAVASPAATVPVVVRVAVVARRTPALPESPDPTRSKRSQTTA
jgi:hypothetical protein